MPTLESSPATFTIDSVPHTMTVQFSIPAGTWTGAAWNVNGVWTVLGVGAGGFEAHSAAHTQVIVNHSPSGTYSDSGIAASAGILADIQAAAGSNIDFSMETHSAVAFASIAVSLLQLVLTGTPAPDHCSITPIEQTTSVNVPTGLYTITQYDGEGNPIAAGVGGQTFILTDDNGTGVFIT